jgi:hypothetical protein
MPPGSVVTARPNPIEASHSALAPASTLVGLDDTEQSTPSERTANAPPPRRRAFESDILAALIIVACAAIITYVFSPGYMNADTLVEYSHAIGESSLNNWHAPALELGWRLLDGVGIGPAGLLAGQVLTFMLGIFLILRTVLRPVTSAFTTVAVTLFPPVLAQLPLLGRDTWMTAAALLALGAIMTASRSQGRAAVFWIASAGIAVFVCLAARQNSFPFVIVLCGIAASQFVRRGTRQRTLMVGGVAIGLLVLLLVLLQGIYAVAGVDQSTRPQTHIFAYDLTAISVREHKVLLGARAFPSQDLSDLSARWDPEDVVTLITDPAGGPPPIRVDTPLGRDPAADELSSEWFDALKKYPATYLAERGALFLDLLGIDNAPQYPMHGGIDGNKWGFAFAHPQLNDAMRSYVAVFAADEGLTRGGLLFRPFIYVVLLVVCTMLLFIRRRRTSEPALSPMVAWFMIAAVGYELTLFPLAMGTMYRFSYPVVVVAVVCMVWTAVVIVRYRSTGRAAGRACGTIAPVSDDSAVFLRDQRSDPNPSC